MIGRLIFHLKWTYFNIQAHLLCTVLVVVGCSVRWTVVCADCGKGGVVVRKTTPPVNDTSSILVINDVRLFSTYAMLSLLSVNSSDICLNLPSCSVIFWTREEIRAWLSCNWVWCSPENNKWYKNVIALENYKLKNEKITIYLKFTQITITTKNRLLYLKSSLSGLIFQSKLSYYEQLLKSYFAMW